MNDTNLLPWLETLPKAELHLHLEGAIPLEALLQLIEKYGGDASVKTLEDLKSRLTYNDFPAFIDAWLWKNAFLREYDDFAFIAEAAARELARRNIRYAETFFSPARFAAHDLSLAGMADAIRRGLDRVNGVEVWLIADLVRDLGPESGARTVAEADEAREFGIVGIGIGGSEHRFPPEPYAALYEDARRRDFKTGAHAGEAAGAESVRRVVEALCVDRIGHGTRAEEDPALVTLLAERGVPLEVCPLSNVATGVVADIAAHPVRRYHDAGIPVTINTDDPGMFHNTLAEEYALLHRVHGFTPAEIQGLVLNALDAAWRPESKGPTLRETFTNDPAWDYPRPT
jgi:adenosine deaminase